MRRAAAGYNNTTTDRTSPVKVHGLSNVRSVTTGGRHACALLLNGGARCWGANGNGQLGDGTTTDRHTPVAVQGLPLNIALWAGLGVFLSCVALELVGAAAATITSAGKFAANPTAGFTSHLPTGVADVTLLAIALGAVCANALNIYSGSMSFLALGIKLPLTLRRAIVALVFGVAGFFLALSGLHDAGAKYNNFLLVIAYWIGPWLGVFFTDQFLRRGKRIDGLLFDHKHRPWAGVAAMAIATVVSIIFFANQTEYVGVVPKHIAGFGDIAFEVGFVLAALLYALFFKVQGEARVEEVLHIPDEPLAVPAD